MYYSAAQFTWMVTHQEFHPQTQKLEYTVEAEIDTT